MKDYENNKEQRWPTGKTRKPSNMPRTRWKNMKRQERLQNAAETTIRDEDND